MSDAVSEAQDRPSRWERIGLAGALLLYFAVGLLSLLVLPPYHPPDEGRHMGYVLALSDGRIPHVLDPVDTKRLHIADFRGTNIQAAAAHPPLYHALAAYPMKLAVARDNPELGVRIARGLSLVFGAFTLVFAFRILRRVAPRRPHLAVAGTAIIATLPIYVNACTIGYNDALAVLSALGAVDAAFAIVAGGFTWRRYATCALWLALASLTRLMSLLAACGAVATLSLAPLLLDTTSSYARRVLVGAARGAGLLAAAAAASGWFYVRNYLTYGDVTASNALLEHLKRRERGLFDAFFSWRWLDLFEHYWVRFGRSENFLGAPLYFGRAFLVVTAICLVIVAVRTRHEIRRLIAPTELTVMRIGGLVMTLGAVVPVFLFFAKGGKLMPRYMMPVAWVEFGLVAAAFSWPRRPWLLQGLIVLLGAFGFMILELYASRIIDYVPLAGGVAPGAGADADDFGIVIAMRAQGVPLPEWWFVGALVAVVAGVMLVLRAVSETYLFVGRSWPREGDMREERGTSDSTTS